MGALHRDTSGESYGRLREAFERLAGTRITTNIATGDTETTSGFGLIESWEIVRRTQGGRMTRVTVTLSEWLFRAICAKSVLTLSRAYFTLRKPLERRVYEIARKHCGRQTEWRIGLPTLHKKAGSAAPLRVFRAALRRMIAVDNLPDYALAEAPGDIIVVTRRRAPVDARDPATPVLTADTMEAARGLAPGLDVYALEAEWRGWWADTGRARPAHPDRAFLAWVVKRAARPQN